MGGLHIWIGGNDYRRDLVGAGGLRSDTEIQNGGAVVQQIRMAENKNDGGVRCWLLNYAVRSDQKCCVVSWCGA